MVSGQPVEYRFLDEVEVTQPDVTLTFAPGAVPADLDNNIAALFYLDVATMEDFEFVAYVIGEDGLATRRPIEIGARSLGAVEIVSGLDAGEQIVISNLDPFRSADRVRLTN